MPLAVAMVLVMNSLGVSRIELMLRDMTSPVVLVHFFPEDHFDAANNNTWLQVLPRSPRARDPRTNLGKLKEFSAPAHKKFTHTIVYLDILRIFEWLQTPIQLTKVFGMMFHRSRKFPPGLLCQRKLLEAGKRCTHISLCRG